MRNTILWLLLSGSIVACTGPGGADKDEFVLRGRLDHGGDIPIRLEELTTTDVIPLDSLHTAPDGSFSYRTRIGEAGFFIFRVDQDNAITLLIEPGEDLFLTGDATRLTPTAEVAGSPGSALLAELGREQWQSYQKADSLRDLLREKRYEPDYQQFRDSMMASFRDVFHGQQAYVMRFIEENPTSLASIIALYQYFGSRLLLKEKDHFEYFEGLSQSLSEAYPTNKHVVDLRRRVSEHRRKEAQRRLAEESLAIGAVAPDIVLPDPEGNQVPLSSLRGKVVLIDFWAAWCPPCRESNKILSKAYERYRDRGFEIYGVSLDRTLDQWVLGIEEDGIDWVQVSDLRFWNSPVVSLYNVESIPHAVLIDQDMRIVARGLEAADLEAALSRLFSQDPTR